MALFSNLLNRSSESKLEGLLLAMSADQITIRYRSAEDIELKIPTALSTAALHAAHGFCESVRHLQQSLKLPAPKKTMKPRDYDLVALEAAAYSHAWLMHDELGVEAFDDDEDGQEDDPRKSHTLAMEMTAAAASPLVSFEVPEDFFPARAEAYRIERASHAEESANQLFQHLILASVKKGRPASMRDATSKDIRLSVAVRGHVASFEETQLPSVLEPLKRLA